MKQGGARTKLPTHRLEGLFRSVLAFLSLKLTPQSPDRHTHTHKALWHHLGRGRELCGSEADVSMDFK
jgi:hypothetical protein